MKYLSPYDMTGDDKKLFDLLNVNNSDVSEQIINLFESNDKLLIDTMYIIRSNSKFINYNAYNMLSMLVNSILNATNDNAKKIVDMVSSRIDEEIFLVKDYIKIKNPNKKGEDEKAKVIYEKVYNDLFKLLKVKDINNGMVKEKKDIDDNVNRFIEIFNKLYTTVERKKTIRMDVIFKNSEFYYLDNKTNNCDNFIKIIDVISADEGQKQKNILLAYSQMFNPYFEHKSGVVIDKKKFINILEKHELFDWKKIPDIHGNDKTFIESLYENYLDHTVEGKIFQNDKAVVELKDDINNIGWYLAKRFAKDTSAKDHQRKKALKNIKEILINSFNPVLFENQHGVSFDKFIINHINENKISMSINEEKRYNKIIEVYKESYPLIEKRMISESVSEIKEKKNSLKRI